MERFRYFLPIVSEGDYDAFRTPLGAQAPATYNEWMKMIGEREKESVLRQEDAIKIPIKTRDFSTYCRTHGEDANMASLFRFVQKVAIGET
ncbi:MAG: hypothetical protein ABSD74_13690 [Rhizomicrobium sp.]